jgi:hypothetical protein
MRVGVLTMANAHVQEAMSDGRTQGKRVIEDTHTGASVCVCVCVCVCLCM